MYKGESLRKSQHELLIFHLTTAFCWRALPPKEKTVLTKFSETVKTCPEISYNQHYVITFQVECNLI